MAHQSAWTLGKHDSASSISIVLFSLRMQTFYRRETYVQKSAWIIGVKFSELLRSDSFKRTAPGSPDRLQKRRHSHFLPPTPTLQGVTTTPASHNRRLVFARSQTLCKWSQTGCAIFVWLTSLRIFVRFILVLIGRNDSFFFLAAWGIGHNFFYPFGARLNCFHFFVVVVVTKHCRARVHSNTRSRSARTCMHAMGLYLSTKSLSHSVWTRPPLAGTPQAIVTIRTPSKSVSSGRSAPSPTLGAVHLDHFSQSGGCIVTSRCIWLTKEPTFPFIFPTFDSEIIANLQTSCKTTTNFMDSSPIFTDRY